VPSNLQDPEKETIYKLRRVAGAIRQLTDGTNGIFKIDSTPSAYRRSLLESDDIIGKVCIRF
jgi:hypothetical protein